MRARTMRLLVLLSTLVMPPFVFAACEPEDGDPPLELMVNLEDAGSACPRGGTLVLVGIDTNRNGTLEEGEIRDSAVICNGEEGVAGAPGERGPATLVRVDEEPAGSTCPAGGVIIRAGVDSDGDEVLDDEEVQSSRPLCNGVDGADGRDGAHGSAGVVNIEDLHHRTTDGTGKLTVVFPTPCVTQVPDLVYVRAVLASDYTDPTPPGLYFPAGTVMKTTILSKSQTGFEMRVTGPEGETIRTVALVDVFYIAVEFAQ